MPSDVVVQKRSTLEPTRRALFRAKESALGSAFWVAVVLVAVGAAIVLALWQAPAV